MTTLKLVLLVLLAISHNHRVSKPRLLPLSGDGLAAPAVATPLASSQPLLSFPGARIALGQRQSTTNAAAAVAAAVALQCGHPPVAAGLHHAAIYNSPLSCLLRACPRKVAAHKRVQHPCLETAFAVFLVVVQTLQCLPGESPQLLEPGAGTPLREVPATGSPVHCRMWATASSCDDNQNVLTQQGSCSFICNTCPCNNACPIDDNRRYLQCLHVSTISTISAICVVGVTPLLNCNKSH